MADIVKSWIYTTIQLVLCIVFSYFIILKAFVEPRLDREWQYCQDMANKDYVYVVYGSKENSQSVFKKAKFVCMSK